MLLFNRHRFIFGIFVVSWSVTIAKGLSTRRHLNPPAQTLEDCLSVSGVRGTCRKINDCQPFLRILLKNRSNSKSRAFDFLRKFHCGFEGIHPIVCCPIGTEPEDVRQTKPSVSLTDELMNSCGAIREMNRIVGGSVTGLSEFPWMALIGYQTRHGVQFRCGGSLISTRYVLTAAHCISSLREITPTVVRLGEYNLATVRDCVGGEGCIPPPVDIKIDQVIPHPDYYKPELRNDIALIRLAEKVKIGEYIRPICLPLDSDLTERSWPGDKAVVTGWGTTQTGVRSQVLLKVIVPIVSNAKCSKMYANNVPITDSQICAGGQAGKDSCSGDSGGPLQTIGKNRLGQPAYVQLGVVSFGPKNCGTLGKPGVYTRVSSYVDWILNHLDE